MKPKHKSWKAWKIRKRTSHNWVSIPELNLNSNRLPVQVSITVPSTKLDKKISKNEFLKRVKSEKFWFSDNFGGDTSVQAEGGYVYKPEGKKGKLITEKVAVVTSSMPVREYLKNRGRIAMHIKALQKNWKQDTIGYQLEGNFYTYPKRKYIANEKRWKNILVR